MYEPLVREKQKEAMALLQKEAFRTPVELLKPGILALIEPSGAAERVLQGQRGVLAMVLDNGRMARLVNIQALPGSVGRPYPLSAMLSELRRGIWSELRGGRVAADVYRRNLQRAYLDVVGAKLNPPTTSGLPTGAPAGFMMTSQPLPGEARAMLRAELTDLDAELASAMGRAADREMRAHLQDCQYQISKILYPDK